MNPLSLLLHTVVQGFSAFGCFKRIQDFLLLEERFENRDIQDSALGCASDTSKGEGFELQDLDQILGNAPHASIVDGDFRWNDTNVLSNITTSFGDGQKGSLTLIIGPIGCGKSSLLKAILGETPSASGLVAVKSPYIAYCDQTPWIMNATIRDNIIAESEGFDEAWYTTVIEACDLVTDLARLPSGSSTVVGDNGLKLSGGQKQRIVCAIIEPGDATANKCKIRQLLELSTLENRSPSLTTS